MTLKLYVKNIKILTIKINVLKKMSKLKIAGNRVNNEILLPAEFIPSELIKRYTNYLYENSPEKVKDLLLKIEHVVCVINEDLYKDGSYINYRVQSNKELQDALKINSISIEQYTALSRIDYGKIYNAKKSLGEELELIFNWYWNKIYPDIPIIKEPFGPNTSPDHGINYSNSTNPEDYFPIESKSFTWKTNEGEYTYLFDEGDLDDESDNLYYYNIGGYNSACGIMPPAALDKDILDYNHDIWDAKNIFNKMGLFWFTHHTENDFHIDFLDMRPLIMSVKVNNNFNNNYWTCNGGVNGNAVTCGLKKDNTHYPEDPAEFVEKMKEIARKDIVHRKEYEKVK